jgi:hypothetical protein
MAPRYPLDPMGGYILGNLRDHIAKEFLADFIPGNEDDKTPTKDKQPDVPPPPKGPPNVDDGRVPGQAPAKMPPQLPQSLQPVRQPLAPGEMPAEFLPGENGRPPQMPTAPMMPPLQFTIV